MSKRTQKKPIFIDKTSRQVIRITRQRFQAIADYHWDHYSYFAHQRSLIFDALKNALASNCRIYTFSQWQRVVNYQFTLEPLSARGSILNDPGGRFNVGDIDSIKFPRFPALYLAEDRETAYKEKFGLSSEGKKSGLTADELLLTSNDALTIVTLKGEIFQVLDLNSLATLKDFFSLINTIKLPDSFIKRANKLNISPMYPVKTASELRKSFLYPDWRALPMHYDIPANPQILGQIAHAAGIEAILYPSKINGKNCLAVYPENFSQSASYLEIEGQGPDKITCKKLDAQTYLSCV